MSMNRKVFFDIVRHEWGPLTQKQVEGYSTILDIWESLPRYEGLPRQWLAYCLATAKHETANTLQPLLERGSKEYLERYDTRVDLGQTPENDDDHLPYIGRGYVQLTGKANYRKVGKKLGYDLLNKPSLAQSPSIAAQILLDGCIQGWFTGRKLGSYLAHAGGAISDDWHGARQVVNRLDKAALIAGYAEVFDVALRAAAIEAKPGTN